MAPVISSLSHADEELLLSTLQTQNPSLRVDALFATPAVKEGENFMSVVTKVEVVAHDQDNGENVKLNLIMKNLPASVERRLTFQCDPAFRNEAVFYSKVLPSMMQQEKLPFPACLHAADDVIILRHLGQDGFVMADRKSGLDLQHCELVLRELGRYHAVSLALKHLRPAEFAEISSFVKEIFLTKENTFINACLDNCMDMGLTVATDLHSPVVKKLKDIRGRGLQVLSPLVTSSGPLAVICHGDLWSNNMLFRYSSDDARTPSDVCFLDLQACRYASPALDILYFLFTSSRPGVARHNFNHLLSVYHSALEDCLSILAPLAEVPTVDDIFAELKHHAVFGLVMSLLVLPVVTAEDVIVNLDDVTEESLLSPEFQEVAENSLMNAEFKRRVNENLEVFALQGLIQ